MVGVSDILKRQQLLSQFDVADHNGKEKIMGPITISGTVVILIGVCLVLILGCVIYIAVKARTTRAILIRLASEYGRLTRGG